MGAFWFVFSLSLFLLSTWFCYRENETRGGLGPVQYLMRLVTAPGEEASNAMAATWRHEVEQFGALPNLRKQSGGSYLGERMS